MPTATLQSRCECQAHLEATIDQNRQVLAGTAHRAGSEPERAPAHSIGADKPRFDVGWLCPFCGRNVLRSFAAGQIVWREASPPAA